MKKLLIALAALLTICASTHADIFSSVGELESQTLSSSSQSAGQYKQQNSNGAWAIVRNGYIPNNAPIGGRQSSGPLYICHAKYNGSVQPGKALAGKCNIGYGGREIALPNFEVLVGNNYSWSKMNNGYIPRNAVVGGYQQDPSYTGPLYICRTAYGDGTHPGKLIAGKCNIGYGGQEIALSNYQVLTQR